jgi:hypothetical protein
MQLLVESNALGIFRGLVEADIEPVLSELLPYYEKDEARHVGLGVLYLPRLLKDLSRSEAFAVSLFQIRCVGMLISAGMPMRDDFRKLGLNPREMSQNVVRLQDEVLRQMRGDVTAAGIGRRGMQGLLNPRKGLGPKILDFVHPPQGAAAAPVWHQQLLRLWTQGARLADRALA